MAISFVNEGCYLSTNNDTDLHTGIEMQCSVSLVAINPTFQH